MGLPPRAVPSSLHNDKQMLKKGLRRSQGYSPAPLKSHDGAEFTSTGANTAREWSGWGKRARKQNLDKGEESRFSFSPKVLHGL